MNTIRVENYCSKRVFDPMRRSIAFSSSCSINSRRHGAGNQTARSISCGLPSLFGTTEAHVDDQSSCSSSSKEIGHPAEFWAPVEKELRSPRVQCNLCPRRCMMKEGQRGFCYVRQNIGGEVRLMTYGRSSGFVVDPVEKKPLNHFLPGSKILSFGTAGCNLGCKFCQNWDISKASTDDRLQQDVSPVGIAAAALAHGTPSVAVTYNDPVIFYEYARDTAAACRAKGVRSVAVTAGYVTDEARESFYDCFDATNVDLKAFTEDFYRTLCNAKLQPVLDTLAYLAKRNNDPTRTPCWFEITTLVIPTRNDSVVETENMCKWLREHVGPFVPLHFTAFHPNFKLTELPPTPPETLARCKDIAHRCGLKYVYTGNVHDVKNGSTFCHECNEPLIVRDWFEIRDYRLTATGQCPKCDCKIPGVFSARPPKVNLYSGVRMSRPQRADMRRFTSL